MTILEHQPKTNKWSSFWKDYASAVAVVITLLTIAWSAVRAANDNEMSIRDNARTLHEINDNVKSLDGYMRQHDIRIGVLEGKQVGVEDKLKTFDMRLLDDERDMVRSPRK